MPTTSSSSASHCDGCSRRLSSSHEKSAVKSVLHWYVTWYVGASRLASATNSRLPWMVYANAGTPVLHVVHHLPIISSRSSGSSPPWWRVDQAAITRQHGSLKTSDMKMATVLAYGGPASAGRSTVLEYRISSTTDVDCSTSSASTMPAGLVSHAAALRSDKTVATCGGSSSSASAMSTDTTPSASGRSESPRPCCDRT